MLTWKAQGPAFASDARLKDGRAAKLVLVADYTNPNGAVLLVPQADGTMETLPLATAADQLSAGDLIETTLMQVRAFGATELPKPELAS